MVLVFAPHSNPQREQHWTTTLWGRALARRRQRTAVLPHGQTPGPVPAALPALGIFTVRYSRLALGLGAHPQEGGGQSEPVEMLREAGDKKKKIQ